MDAALETAAPPQFEVVSVSRESADLKEQVGARAKFWFERPGKTRWLFKEIRPGTGEDWAEKVAAELADRMGLPHARYELAECGGARGVITPSFVPPGGQLEHGSQLLVQFVRGYSGARRFRNRGHTLRRVLAVLHGVGLPPHADLPSEFSDGVDAFVGFLALDAWIANQDRHHDNWGVIAMPNQQRCLAPTFDHSSSLGRNETDAVRGRLLSQNAAAEMRQFVSRAQSAFYATPSAVRPITTLEAFGAAARQRPRAARAWLERLERIMDHESQSILERIPSSHISALAIQFAHRMLVLNRERLLSTEGANS